MFSKVLILTVVAVAVSTPSSTYAYTPPYASSYTSPYASSYTSPYTPAPPYTSAPPYASAPPYTSSYAPSSTARAPTGTAGAPSPCIYGCIVPAAVQNGCSGLEDLPCVCRNAQFQSDAGACLAQHCTPGDVQAALQLQQQACAAGGITPSFTATPTPRPVSFTSVPVSSGSSGRPSVSSPSSGPSVSSPTTPPSGSSVSRSATAVAVGTSVSPSAAAGTSPQVGAGAFLGAILAVVFAI